ncbi:MAG: hypothetical protein AB1746_12240 [Candidatus Zixiibacteriota bacterium]
MFRYSIVFFSVIILSLACSSPTGEKTQNSSTVTGNNGISLQIGGQNSETQTCPSTPISFTIPEGGYVDIWITSATGYHIKIIVDHVYYEAGAYNLSWDFLNDDGETIVDGFYLYNLRAKGFMISQLYFVKIGNS